MGHVADVGESLRPQQVLGDEVGCNADAGAVTGSSSFPAARHRRAPLGRRAPRRPRPATRWPGSRGDFVNRHRSLLPKAGPAGRERCPSRRRTSTGRRRATASYEHGQRGRCQPGSLRSSVGFAVVRKRTGRCGRRISRLGTSRSCRPHPTAARPAAALTSIIRKTMPESQKFCTSLNGAHRRGGPRRCQAMAERCLLWRRD